MPEYTSRAVIMDHSHVKIGRTRDAHLEVVSIQSQDAGHKLINGTIISLPVPLIGTFDSF